jgi:hypothetical protein
VWVRAKCTALDILSISIFRAVMAESEAEVAASAMRSGGEVGGAGVQTITKKTMDGRYIFEHEGQTVYEWEQNIEEVNIYIRPPPGVTKAHLDITITHERVTIGIKGEVPFIDEKTGGAVKVSESFWTLGDGELNITLCKMLKADMWECALHGVKGGKVDPYTIEQEKKKLMLERFQEENPGFDFSGAEFNGDVPSAKDFMGGVKYT